MHTHMHVERADVDHMSRDARFDAAFERAVAPCLAAGVHARRSSDQGCASAAASSARRRLQSLQALLRRRCAQMEAPPQSLQMLLMRLCWQMFVPPQSLQVLLTRLCGHMLVTPQSLQWRCRALSLSLVNVPALFSPSVDVLRADLLAFLGQ